MGDNVKALLADLNDPTKYVRKTGVPWFCPHVREVWNDKLSKFEQVEVRESDLPEIFQNMSALARNGRAFRITNGHIKKLSDEKDQPELLGLALPEGVSTFGEDNIPCVNMTEYIKVAKAGAMEDRPYRSAEYYRQKKLITGAAALIRDPQLNLGTVLYSDDDATVIYAEPVDVLPESSSNENDPSPEEVEMFERCWAYIQKKMAAQQPQQPQQNAMGAMGPANAMPQPAAYQEQDMATEVLKPEEAVHYAELTKRAESAEKRLAEIEKERVREKTEALLDKLGNVEHFKFDRDAELELMQATDDAGREKIAARIRKYHEKQPGHDDEVPVSYEADKPLPQRKDDSKNPFHEKPDFYEETLEYCRATGEVDFEKAHRAVEERELARKKK